MRKLSSHHRHRRLLRRMGMLLVGVLVSSLAACAHQAELPLAAKSLGPGSKFVAYGRQAMVATAHPLATAAGLTMLERGGNAIDAFAAASFAVGVVRPQSTGLGGGGFALVRFSSPRLQGVEVAADFRESAPAAARGNLFTDPKLPPDASLFGPYAVAVPGIVAGVLKLHERYGRLPLAEVMAPAIRLAEDGFPVYDGLAAASVKMAPELSRHPETARIFLPGGKPLRVGEILRQPDLARTLRAISERGPAAFYDGPIAQAIGKEMQRLGGILNANDLKSYRVIDRVPLHGTYKDFNITTMPPPSSGVLLIEMLNMLAAAGPGAGEASAAERLHLLAEVMSRAYQDRAVDLGDPAYYDVPTELLMSPAYAAERMRTFDPLHTTPPAPIAAGERGKNTTQISIVDAEGNAVSATESINYAFGSGITVPGTGILLNDTMDDFATHPGKPNVYGLVGSAANAVAPGKRPLSSMCPTIVRQKDGRMMLVLGSPGGSTIITSVLQTMLNVMDRGMGLPEAVAAPRIHDQAYPNLILYEPGAISPEAKTGLEQRGHVMREVRRLGDVQAVLRTSYGALVGVSDPRGDGQPAGY